VGFEPTLHASDRQFREASSSVGSNSHKSGPPTSAIFARSRFVACASVCGHRAFGQSSRREELEPGFLEGLGHDYIATQGRWPPSAVCLPRQGMAESRVRAQSESTVQQAVTPVQAISTRLGPHPARHNNASRSREDSERTTRIRVRPRDHFRARSMACKNAGIETGTSPRRAATLSVKLCTFSPLIGNTPNCPPTISYTPFVGVRLKKNIA